MYSFRFFSGFADRRFWMFILFRYFFHHSGRHSVKTLPKFHSLFCIPTSVSVFVTLWKCKHGLSTTSGPIGVNVSYLQNRKLSHMHISSKTRTTVTLQVNSFLVTHSLLVTTCILNYGTSAVVSHSQLIFRDRFLPIHCVWHDFSSSPIKSVWLLVV